MSVEALAWVFSTNRWTKGEDRLVLLAYADSADRGTGYGFTGVDTLAEAACVHRTTVMKASRRLEAAGELLVHRPQVRGRGRSNTYVVVCGRDPYELATARGWSRPALSAEAEARLATARGSRSVTDTEETSPSEATEPAPEQRSPAATISSKNGRRKVAEWSAQERPSPAPSPKTTNPAPGARVVVESVGPVPAELAELAGLITAGGVTVRWDLPPEKIALVAAVQQLVPVEQLAAVAVDLAGRRGTPRSATAWLTPWTDLGRTSSPAAATTCPVPRELPPPCGHCDGHHGGPRRLVLEDGRPGDWCPRCSAAALREPAF